MPDVGVLELKIRDNSQTAGQGLQYLSDALVAVKHACIGGLGLGNSKTGVIHQIQALADAVKNNNTTIKNLGTLFNALSSFAKLKDVTINTEPIAALKTALEGGLHIGKAGTEINKLREAFTGDWGSAENATFIVDTMKNVAEASQAMAGGNTAGTIKAVAKAITDYSSAIQSVSGGGAHDYLQQQVFSSAESYGTGKYVAEGIKQGIEAGKEAVINAAKELAQTIIDTTRNTLEEHSPSHVARRSGQNYGAGLVEGLIETKSEIQRASAEVAETVNETFKNVMIGYGSPVMLQNSLSDYLSSPLESYGMKAMIASEATEKYKNNVNAVIPALKEYRDTVLSMSGSREEIAGFSKKTAEDFVTPLKEAEAETRQVVEQIREDLSEGFGTGSIKPLVERQDWIGSALRGLYGLEMQAKVIKEVSNGTGLPVEEIQRQLTEMSEGYLRFGEQAEKSTAVMEHSINRVKDAVTSTAAVSRSTDIIPIEKFISAYSHADYLKGKIEELTRELEIKRNLGLLDKDSMDDAVMRIRKLQEEYNKLTEAQEEANASAFSLGGAWKDLRSAIDKMFPGLTRLRKQFTNILRRRAITYIIRQVAAGLKEGVQNVYEYSKAIGSSFAPSMDSAASSLATMKNALGAAAAPLIQSLIPVLQTVVNWFITLVNYANQFIALMRGQSSWTRAVPQTTTAFKDQEKAAKSAGSAVKDLLADWDELNIIQSQGGGGGAASASADAADYLNMFEEVTHFDNKIKEVVDYIKENFDSILTIAKDIGATILLWKVATALGGLLGIVGQFAGILAAVGLLKLTFDLSTLFTNNYLDSGEEGWLVADFLTTLIAGFFTKKILDSVLKGNIGLIAIPLTFAVSAGATVMATIKDTDVSALSEESVKASVLAGLEGGFAAGYLVYKVGGGIAAALGIGAAAALLTFGVAVELKAAAQISTEGLTEENVGAAIIGIVTQGAGGGLAGAILAAKYGAAIGAGAAAGAMLFGGAAVVTLGVAVGLNAINTVAEAGEITREVVEKNLLSAGIVGAGLALVAASTVGLPGVVALAAVGGAAIWLGTLFGIEGTVQEKAKVKFGNYQATKEEIEGYVNTRLFKDPPSITISLVKAKFEALGNAKTNLAASAALVIGTIDAARIGILTTPAEMAAQIDAFIADFNSTKHEYQNALEVALSIAPATDIDGNNISSTLLSSSNQRWGILTGIMEDLGNQLADAYKIAYDARLAGNIDEDAEYTIQKITEMMSRVTEAIAGGSARAKANRAIVEAMGDLSEDALKGTLEVYKAQQEALIKELTAAREDAAEGFLAQKYAFETLAKYALEDAGGDTTNEMYQYYMDMAKQAGADYERAMANIEKDVQNATDNMLDEVEKNRLRERLIGMIQRQVSDYDFGEFIANSGYGDLEILSQYMVNSIKGVEGRNIDDEANKLFESFLVGLVGADNYDLYKGYIDTGILKWTDLFDKEFIDKISQVILGDNVTDEVREKWNKAVSKIIGEEYKAPEIVGKTDFSELFKNAGIPEQYNVKIVLELTNSSEELLKELKGIVYSNENGLNDTKKGIIWSEIESLRDWGHIDELKTLLEFMNQYGAGEGFDRWSEYEPDETAMTRLQRMAASGMLVRESGGMGKSDVGWMQQTMGSVFAGAASDDQMQSNIETGAKKGTADMLTVLNNLLTVAQAINRKDFTVVIKPTATMGDMMARSADLFGMVTGE